MDRETSLSDFPHAPSGDFDHIPVDESILLYTQCALCVAECPEGECMRNFARLNVGLTPLGIQIYCVRHDANVAHFDFQGVSHPMNSCREKSAAYDTFDLPGEGDAPDEQSEKIIDVLNSAEALCDNWADRDLGAESGDYPLFRCIPEFADLQRSLKALAETEFGPPEDYEI